MKDPFENCTQVVVWKQGDTHVRPFGVVASPGAPLSETLVRAPGIHKAIVPWALRRATVSAVEKYIGEQNETT